MNTKRSLAVLCIALTLLFAVPARAFAVEGGVGAQDFALTFDSLLFLTLSLGALVVVVFMIALFAVIRYRKQKKQICKNYACSINPLISDDMRSTYDFRAFETPQEFQRLQFPDEVSSAQASQPYVQMQPASQAPQDSYAYSAQQASAPQASAGYPVAPDVYSDNVSAQSPQAVVAPQPLAPQPQVRPMDFTFDMIERVLAQVGVAANAPVAPSDSLAARRDTRSTTQDFSGYIPRHVKPAEGSKSGNEPLLQAVPNMKHARSSGDLQGQTQQAV